MKLIVQADQTADIEGTLIEMFRQTLAGAVAEVTHDPKRLVLVCESKLDAHDNPQLILRCDFVGQDHALQDPHTALEFALNSMNSKARTKGSRRTTTGQRPTQNC